MDNIHVDEELPADTLRRAVNVDITDAGKVRRRNGYRLVTAMQGAHSLWSDTLGNGYFVQNNRMKALLLGGVIQDLGEVQAGNNHVSFVKVNNDVYYSCASAKGKITDKALKPWGVEVPTSTAQLSPTIGLFNAGTYYAAVTYVLADGRESGASALSSINLSAIGGIAVIAMPTPVMAEVVKKRLYLSTGDGEVLYLAKEFDVLDQFTTITSPIIGSELRTAYLAEPILSNGIAEVSGRIFMISAAEKNVVFYTEALAFDHMDVRKNHYNFPAEVTLIASTRSGLYVCADKTYYIQNAGQDEASQVEVFDYVGIANTAQLIPASHEYIWMTNRGAVIGHDGGQAELLASETLTTGMMIRAASMVREQDGIRQFVVTGTKTEAISLESGSYFNAEITRRAHV